MERQMVNGIMFLLVSKRPSGAIVAVTDNDVYKEVGDILSLCRQNINNSLLMIVNG